MDMSTFLEILAKNKNRCVTSVLRVAVLRSAQAVHEYAYFPFLLCHRIGRRSPHPNRRKRTRKAC